MTSYIDHLECTICGKSYPHQELIGVSPCCEKVLVGIALGASAIGCPCIFCPVGWLLAYSNVGSAELR